ncbi:lysosomal amino acid transporter 1 homolog isoform X2 [Melanotaenia boesemani]|uniref:lysosomal amino acid transporter 1 homolog isoform X2 n=1 Tax=Melanotaenia boesemani TaxID=1250792 RepID=UPI001C05D233|nr:lysosomal amino acid transporter 1 homolog isoform X2 [Melanotaenia boesemani]
MALSAATQNMWTDRVLTRRTLGWTTEGNFTSLCPNGSKWVWEGLGECAQDGRDMASIYLGLLSILCFMVSSLPQYYSSCKKGNMDSALSIWFLLLWLGGDSCNLVGSYLADQLPLQKYTAIYYVIADMLMLAMYMYYKLRNRMAEGRRVLNVVGISCILGATASLTIFPGVGPSPEIISTGFRSRSLLSTTDASSIQAFTPKEIIGFSIGSVSSVLYLCSRLPQMYTNYKRKSTEGVSYFLFALVILGNTTYGLSVLLKNPEQGQAEKSYLVHHLPWLIGSLGTLSLDLIISVQFMIYRKTPAQNANVNFGNDETTPLMES